MPKVNLQEIKVINMSEKQPPKDLDEVILSDEQGNKEVYKILFTFDSDDYGNHMSSYILKLQKMQTKLRFKPFLSHQIKMVM